MDEELIRKKRYRALRRQLNSLKNAVSELQSTSDDVKSKIKQSLLVDGKILEENLYDNVKKDVDSIYDELANTVIPMVSNKC